MGISDKESVLPESEEPEIQVEDRRFWARPEAGAAAEDGGLAASRQPTYVQELEARVQAAEHRCSETLAAHRRMQAEFDDFRARLNRDFDARVQHGKAAAFRRFLDVADHMELALQAAQGQDAAVAEGIRLILGQLQSALRDEGVERLEVVGAPFDPEVAEAVAVVPVEDPSGHDQVLVELRPGYRMGEWTLRPAQVQVGRYAAGTRGETPSPPAGSGPAG